MNDDTLYVAPSSKHTDYSQPPLNNFYYGVLNTGRRRYAHPALSGKLPFPWLPAVKKAPAFGDGAKERRGVVLSLRRKMGQKLSRGKDDGPVGPGAASGRTGPIALPEDWRNEGQWGDTLAADGAGESSSQAPARGMGSSASSSSNINPWGDPTPSLAGQIRRQLSFDPGSGVIALPDEENVWDDPDSEEGDEDNAEGASPVSHDCAEFIVRAIADTSSPCTTITQRGARVEAVQRLLWNLATP